MQAKETQGLTSMCAHIFCSRSVSPFVLHKLCLAMAPNIRSATCKLVLFDIQGRRLTLKIRIEHL